MANKPYYGNYSATLNLTYPGGTRIASINGKYKELVIKEIEIDNADGFIEILQVNTELSTAGAKTIAADTYRDFNALLIENISDVAIEVMYHTGAWTNASPDTYTGAAAYLTTFVPANGYTFIENPRIISYANGTQSSMNGTSANTTAFNPTHIIDSGVDLGASITAAYDDTTITVDGTERLVAGDLLALSPFTDGDINTGTGAHTFEIIRVKYIINAVSIEVERGLMGTVPCAHDHTSVKQEDLYFWGINEHIQPAFYAWDDFTLAVSTATDTGGAMATLTASGGNFIDAGFQPGMMLAFVRNGGNINDDMGIITEVTQTVLTFHRWSTTLSAFTPGGNWAFAAGFWCGTDGRGRYKSNYFLGADTRSPNHVHGLVPGAQYFDFPVPVEQRLGMKNLTARTKSGLAASTEYKFTLNLDGQREDIAFTTDSDNLNWGGSTGVLSKLQNAVADEVKNGTLYRNVSVAMENGDIVFKSLTGGGHWNGYISNRAADFTNRSGASQIDIQDSASGTQFLGAGNVPGAAHPATSNDFMPTEGVHPDTNEVIDDPSNMLLDRGDGNLRRAYGGNGTINYESGAIELFGLPAWSQMHGYYITASAHCGQLDTTPGEALNGIYLVKARSVNAAANALIRITILA